ncbi:hypothetical protein F2Q70_00007585 [Brassica cretica]|uniref:Uncharacterized protein n=1 Tax=Brassica cretica TaxID=69181 RepID=A0A8S9M3J1_BRACR|nr:hypothetical protein F2Q70_00007585 [Brassica cretica]
MEFSGAFEIQEGGVELQVVGPLWEGSFLEASAWASQLYQLVTHIITAAFLWRSCSCVLHALGNPFKTFPCVLSSSSGFSS